MECYKVTTPSLYSLAIGHDARVQYSTQEYVCAPSHLADLGMHLFTFRDKFSAYLFSLSSWCPCIWLADGLEEVAIPLKVPTFFYACTFRSNANPAIMSVPPTWPSGTVMFKQVKLIREFDESELKELSAWSKKHRVLT